MGPLTRVSYHVFKLRLQCNDKIMNEEIESCFPYPVLFLIPILRDTFSIVQKLGYSIQ